MTSENGSWQLIQTLLSHELIDEFRLWIFPVVVDPGKRLFGQSTVPTDLALVKTKTTSNGVMMSIYRRAGKIPCIDMEEICPCPNLNCPNHGDCEKCTSRHVRIGFLNY